MIYAIDANVLLRFTNRRDPLHPTMRIVARKLRRSSDQLQTTAQNCVEFWNVATRPLSVNGLGLSPVEADRLLRLIERLFPRLNESPDWYAEWRRLVVLHGVSGAKAHDARLAATLLTSGVTRILTMNTADFTRFGSEGLVAVDPAAV